MAIERVTPPLVQHRLNPTHTVPTRTVNAPSCYKDMRNRAVEVMLLAGKNCTEYATLCHDRARDSLAKMQEASNTSRDQQVFAGMVLVWLTALFGGAGIASAAINPQGVNEELLKTIKGVSDTMGRSLQSATSATDTLSKGHQEPTNTRKTVAQTGTQASNTVEGEMDTRVKTMYSTTQQLIETTAIKV